MKKRNIKYFKKQKEIKFIKKMYRKYVIKKLEKISNDIWYANI